jgi:hypothetical protein
VNFASGPIPGLCDAFERLGDFVIEHMRILGRGLDVGVVERPLHQLEVAGLAQQLGREIVPEVMEAEADHPRALA